MFYASWRLLKVPQNENSDTDRRLTHSFFKNNAQNMHDPIQFLLFENYSQFFDWSIAVKLNFPSRLLDMTASSQRNER